LKAVDLRMTTNAESEVSLREFWFLLLDGPEDVGLEAQGRAGSVCDKTRLVEGVSFSVHK
jgi:hypothetical protein